MRPSTTVVRLAGYLSWAIAFILVLLPFHAFLTVWLSSAVGHYTILRLWKEWILVLVFAGVIYILAVYAALRKQLFASRLFRLIVIYTLLLLLSGVVAALRHSVNAEALGYGFLVDTRFLAMYVITWTVAACSPLLRKKWPAVLFVPGVAVVIFGILQYLALPYDFLKHFGYGPSTISPYETINHNVNHLRIESTLRGANPLGAYLVLLITALAAGYIFLKRRRLWLIGLAFCAALAMVFTYSRSAWIGLFLSLVTFLYLSIRNSRLKRQVLTIVCLAALAAGLAAYGLRNNQSLQDTLLHTDSQSSIATTSNQGHSAAFKGGVHDIVHQPLGSGVGTAGPASVYNNHPTRIAENYFLQIGQEAGVLGMGLFIAINVVIGRLLWLRRAEPLALALFASLVGLTFVNLLSHAWTDDTLAYIWWGLAGIVLAPDILKANKAQK